MLRIALFFWVIAYFKHIITSWISYVQIRKALVKLVAFAVVYGNSQPHFRPPRETYNNELTDLLKYNSAIKELVSYPELSYKQTDEETFQAANILIAEIQMQQNAARHKLIHSLNPLISVKDLILLPVTVIKDLGFNPGKKQSLAIEILTILISKLVDLFTPEIKALIVMLFENFVHSQP